ncbi:hypothetical protein XA68_13456 [Ophiocordyceps unilateralis]|uniref:polynucleotide adenylyltransferase n=1 Tax=Ophiocordyceps unilateralis TaxID=268505 RepID=A0A2A9PAR2_OPHUN|nr:hypothetical protein XA68_13456 [Ophiocordyceps unilateralis]
MSQRAKFMYNKSATGKEQRLETHILPYHPRGRDSDIQPNRRGQLSEPPFTASQSATEEQQMDYDSESPRPRFTPSHDTALCLTLPRDHTLWPAVQQLRSLNDAASSRWPPHINLVYPFVQTAALPEATCILRQLRLEAVTISLSEVGSFAHKGGKSTIFLRPAETASLARLRTAIRRALGWLDDVEAFEPHLTVAQSDETGCEGHISLVEEARSLTPLCFAVSGLCIMVREPSADFDGGGPRRMNLWAQLDLGSGQVQDADPMLEYAPVAELRKTHTYYDGVWASMTPPSQQTALIEEPHRLVLASYNVSAEPGPDPFRYAALVANILSIKAAADFLVLQEVTDQFLSFLGANSDICTRYPYSTHGLVGQRHETGAPPWHEKIVVLSRFPFSWKWVPFNETHGGIAVLEFYTLQVQRTSKPQQSLIVAAFHLNPGSDEETLASRKCEVRRLLRHLASQYPDHPHLIASHLSMDTSYSVLNKTAKQGLEHAREIESLLLQAGLEDGWLLSRLGPGESSSIASALPPASELHEGEEGATFDPVNNSLAAQSVMDEQNARPQRYSRIFASGNLALRPAGFNLFGQSLPAASQHWGIRCLFSREANPKQPHLATGTMRVDPAKAQQSIQVTDGPKSVLARRGYLPTWADQRQRWEAIQLLQRIVLGPSSVAADDGSRGKGPRIAVIPVGSFGLGLWTTSSHVDCLCVGSMSPNIFFPIVTERLRDASADDIVILRRVRSASGTMLELQVQGIHFDLWYCAAPSIAESYPDVMKRPSSDQAFALPTQTLLKLKPARDLFYLRKSIPDMAAFRLAHLLIRAWAESRGLYASRFGLLGGFHITTMLVPICKLLSWGISCVRASDIIRTFFHHYAGFSWSADMVYDSYFHPQLAYSRTPSEPLCLLGWHGPRLNAAVYASRSSADIISLECSRADSLLSQEGITWSDFLGLQHSAISSNQVACGVAEFLDRYSSYVKIEARYWGTSPLKRIKFFRKLESRFSVLLLDADRSLPTVGMHFWPVRLVQPSSSTVPEDSTEYTGYYLIGLYQRRSPVTVEWSSHLNTSDTEALQTKICDFEAAIRGASGYYDPNCSWVMACIMETQDLSRTLQPDPQPGTYTSNPDDETESESDAELLDDDDDDDEGDGKRLARTQTHSYNKPKPSGGRFRPAADVINRIRWDSAMDAADYVVGYEDRFVGVRERALEAWKRELTDEEFIPQHRIVYFKRRSDGELMWDRRSRTDHIFKSSV